MITPTALWHEPRPPYAHVIRADTVRVRLRTSRADRVRCYVEWADPYDWPIPDRVQELRRLAADDLYIYWEAELAAAEGRVRYLFRIEDANAAEPEHTWWFGGDGLTTARPPIEWPDGYFHWPYIHPSEVPAPPAWVREAICYEIFPDRFARDDECQPPAPGWPGRPTARAIWGGTLGGLIAHLPYVASLGVNLLWLTPIFAAPSNHKYDTADYTRIDPQFGNDEVFARFVAESHRQGLRVVLDGVFNHCGALFGPWEDVVARGRASPYWGWFEVQGERPDPATRNYRTFGHTPSMPRLMTDNPEVQAYLIERARRWTRMGIDGWRLDSADTVDPTFWRRLRRELRAINPQLYLVGEIGHEAGRWLEGDQFDGVMHYPLRGALLRWLAAGRMGPDGHPAPGAPEGFGARLTARGFAARLGAMRAWYAEWARVGSLNPAGTHDVPRLLTALGEDRQRWRLALAFILGYEGIPQLYYGDEVGLRGGEDPDCRGPMEWNPDRQDGDMLAWTRELVWLRRRTPALRSSGVWPLHADDGGMLALLRGESAPPGAADQTDVAVMVLNASEDGERTLTLDLAGSRGRPEWPAGQWAQDALSGERWQVSDGQVTLPVGPLDVRVLVPCPPAGGNGSR
jgi:cyclomaltodextrinase / maltogenic alpha-amylase / neopullulanase